MRRRRRSEPSAPARARNGASGWLFAAGLLAASCNTTGVGFGNGPRIVSPFQAKYTANGFARPGRHSGVDIYGEVGTPVVAAADGNVERLLHGPWVGSATSNKWCGNGVELLHRAELGEDYATRYCHLSHHTVSVGETVRRGQVIGYVGITGWTSERNPHLHFEVRLRQTWGAKLDPEKHVVGCPEPGRSYPDDRVVLTWPLGC